MTAWFWWECMGSLLYTPTAPSLTLLVLNILLHPVDKKWAGNVFTYQSFVWFLGAIKITLLFWLRYLGTDHSNSKKEKNATQFCHLHFWSLIEVSFYEHCRSRTLFFSVHDLVFYITSVYTVTYQLNGIYLASDINMLLTLSMLVYQELAHQKDNTYIQQKGN